MENKILDSFRNKNFKYGGYAALLVAIVFAILVAVNMLLELIPLKLDLTKEKMYSLSEQTKNILKNLDKDVDIYVLSQTGKENPTTGEILGQYSSSSKRMRVQNIDPYRNPAFVQKYEEEKGKTPSVDSVIVVTGDKFKVISPYEMVNFRQADPNNPFSQEASSLKVEQAVTGAILSITSAKKPVAYSLTGHKESGLPYNIRQELERENYVLKELNLLTEDGVPADADILVVISPKYDIHESEGEKMRDFLFDRKGKMFLAMDLLDEEFPNLSRLLASYGVSMEPVFVLERELKNFVRERPLDLIPILASHSITDTLGSEDMVVLFPRSQAIKELDVKKRSIEIEPVLSSSNKSYAKTKLDADNINQSLRDPVGPFNLAVAIRDKADEEGKPESRAVVTASSLFLYPEIRGLFMQQGNIEFLLNSLSWLQGKEELISIRPKSLLVMSLSLNQVQFYIFAGIAVILIPLLILGTGLAVWLRRRHL
ncbi:MAG TPA: GldG family protein [Spirochaetia bacterium]|nr:GldG family protein [Spirochaetia bacterium]